MYWGMGWFSKVSSCGSVGTPTPSSILMDSCFFGIRRFCLTWTISLTRTWLNGWYYILWVAPRQVEPHKRTSVFQPSRRTSTDFLVEQAEIVGSPIPYPYPYPHPHSLCGHPFSRSLEMLKSRFPGLKWEIFVRHKYCEPLLSHPTQ